MFQLCSEKINYSIPNKLVESAKMVRDTLLNGYDIYPIHNRKFIYERMTIVLKKTIV